MCRVAISASRCDSCAFCYMFLWECALAHLISAACALAQCSVKNGFSSKGKTIIFDCSEHQSPNPVTDQHQIGRFNYVDGLYKCCKFHCNHLRNGAPTYWCNITPMCIFSVFSVCKYIYIYIYIYIILTQIHSPKHASHFDARWLKRRGLVQGSTFCGVRMMKIYHLVVCSPKNRQ